MRGRMLKRILSGKRVSYISVLFGIHRQALHRWIREAGEVKVHADCPDPRHNRLVCEEADISRKNVAL